MNFSDYMHAGRYQGYTYSYPHKTAYRPLESRAVGDVWRDEPRESLFLYMHIPFCEMRCGFCNLFTLAKPGDDLQSRYLDVLETQARLTHAEMGPSQFSRFAIGGGTPTQLDPAGIERLFDIAESVGARPADIPVSFEMSPDTVDSTKLAILKARGVTRASIGVQSFEFNEVKAVRRPQTNEVVFGALDAISTQGFDVFNIDLIYGMPHQTSETFVRSIETALRFAPDELYLYPLYVRPLTGLGNSTKSWDDHRHDIYVAGRDALLNKGWEQVSMRMFRRPGSGVEGPVYRCQEDGMLGLGVGARSYTHNLHYSAEYAVGRRGVQGIIDDFVARTDTQLASVNYGFELDDAERAHRHVVLSILSADGLDPARYELLFNESLESRFPQISQLEALGFVTRSPNLTLTQEGQGWSDAIGPWLYSSRVNALSQEYELS